MEYISNEKILSYILRLLKLIKQQKNEIYRLKNNQNNADVTNIQTIKYIDQSAKIKELQVQIDLLKKLQANPNIEANCKKYLTSDIITDINYYKNKLDDINLLKSPNVLGTQEYKIILDNKLKSQKYLIIGEYYFNNMIAENLPNYLCDKILKN